MKCYYCNTDILNFKTKHSIWCDICAIKYKCNGIITSYDDCSVKYFHIYIELENNKEYHIRMHFKDNFTYIGALNENRASKEVMTVPGLSITPDNVKEKLKTYLLFI